MGIRALPALCVVLSLTAPPVASLVCAWVCADGAHEAHAGAPVAGHHHHAGASGAPEASVAGEDVCRHEPAAIQLFRPSTGHQAPSPAVHAVAAAVAPQEVAGPSLASRYGGGWRPPDDRALSPAHRSPILRI